MVFERFEAFKLRCTIHLVIYPLRNSPTDSGDEADFLALANYLHDELGYQTVNWNLGCSAGTTPSRLRGAGLLEHPELIDRFLNDACRGFNGKISIKMRLGMNSPQECLTLLPILNRYPLSEICMHPRIGLQGFSGSVDLNAFASFCKGLIHPVLYNGDIRTGSDAHAILTRFPFVSGLMLGRGVIANPFLPKQIVDYKNEENFEKEVGVKPASILSLKRFHDELFQAYIETMEGGSQPVLGRMRELWPYWESLFAGKERIIRALIKAPSLAAYKQLADQLLR